MSYRKAKQLLEKKKQMQMQTPLEEQEEEEEHQHTLPRSNAFAVLDTNNESEEEEETDPIQNEQNIKQKDKPKKKKKKKNKAKKVKENESDQEVRKVKQMIKQLGMERGESEGEEQTMKEEWISILQIQEGKFNYERELRRHFRGWEMEKDEGDPQMTKKQQKMQKHLKKMMKKSVLSPGISEYFPIRQKFEMLREDQTIQFTASKKYASLQKQYELIRNSNDINALIQFTQLNPEHVDSLYDVGEFLRLQGNYRDADSLIQRVIYIYEMAASYDLGEFLKQPLNKRRIIYDHTSKSLFMSLFKFMDILGKKGCFRASLEYNKFLLKINLDDPTACLLCMDFNAISSKQYEFIINFVRFYSQYCGFKNKSAYLMPNFTYSVALAKFLWLSEPQKEKDNELLVQENNIKEYLIFRDQHWKQALSWPQAFRFDTESPQVLILRAIMMYSKLIIDIAAKNEYSKQFLNSEQFRGWQSKPFKDILAHQFWSMVPQSYVYHFLNLQNVDDSQGLDKVLDVYVERSKILWKSSNVMLWIKGALGFVLNKIDQKFDYQSYLENLCLEQGGQVLGIPFSLNRYCNINRNNFSDRVDRIDLNNIQDNQQNQPLPGQQLNMNQNGFQLFLNSLLPWVNLPGARQEGQEDPDMPFIEEDEY